MAYSDTIKFVVGDTLPSLEFTLKDSNTATAVKTLAVQNSDTWDAIDLYGTAGTFEGELEYTTSGGGIHTVQDLIKFKVRDDFD